MSIRIPVASITPNSRRQTPPITGTGMLRISVASLPTNETRIAITHGTDTMVQTAAHLGREIQGKTIVLTGAMVPYKFGSSDGLFNMGSALAFVQTLPPGVYIAMNGQVFRWDRVRKNKEKGVFEAD